MTETQVVKYDVTDAAIAEMKDLYIGLVITDLEDKEQYDAVHSAHMVVKGKRIEVDKKRKELKADALAWGKTVQTEANRIFGLIEPIESHLKAEKQKVKDEQELIEQERIAQIKDEIDSWEKYYLELNGMGTPDELDAYISKLEAIRDLISPELYFEFTGSAIEICNNLLVRAKQDLETRERLDREDAERKAESERQAKVKAEQDRIAAEQKAAQDKLDAAQKKIDDEKFALEAEKKAEADRKEREEFEKRAIERAKDAAIEKAKQDAIAKVETEKAEAAEKKRQEALKPDKEKMMGFAQFLQDGMTLPVVSSDRAKECLKNAAKKIYDIGEMVIADAENL